MDKNAGFYMDTAPKILDFGGKQVITAFRDSAVYQDDNGFRTERRMQVDGKEFYVKSYFPSVPNSTPTGQMMKLIDSAAKAK